MTAVAPDLIYPGQPTSGSIDNLYLSTGGYAVLVETKLWRNPQARREVLSQTLDYIKDLAREDRGVDAQDSAS